MEDPGYLGARFAWMNAGATIQPAPVDENGLVLPSRQSAAPVLTYTTPSRQFPTGACLPIGRRLSLIDFATRSGSWIVEDDYDSEFRYTRPPLPSLHSLDPGGCVIYVGSMSKVLFPSLRIGYVVLPENLVEGFAALRAILDDHGPLIDQAALAEFIEAGAFYTHIRRCRREYGERLAVFLKAAEEVALPLRFPHTDGGMNVTGFMDPAVNDSSCSQALQAANFEVPPLSHYSLAPTAPGLVFGFTAFAFTTIRVMLKRVALSLHSALKGS
jgi:GntR family transcriptional regulator/MocR family aminotransferase